jgi:hypothetical protein
MHRYQVAKYVIFDSEKIFVKKFPWMLKWLYFSIQGNFLTNILSSKENFTKIKKFQNAVVEKIVF